MLQSTLILCMFYLPIITLSTPSPTSIQDPALPHRDEYIRSVLDQHLPIPDLAHIINQFEGGYDETTALQVFHNPLVHKGEEWNEHYSSDHVFVPSGTKIALGTLSQLSRDHFKDTSLLLMFNIIVAQDCELSASAYAALGVQIVEFSTGNAQGCVSYNAMIPNTEEKQIMVYVLLDSVIASSEWYYELVLPRLSLCKSSYQVQAVYEYNGGPLADDLPDRILFGQPKFNRIYPQRAKKKEIEFLPGHLKDLIPVYDAWRTHMSLPLTLGIRKDMLTYRFPALRFASNTCIDLGTTTDLIKDISSNGLRLTAEIKIVSLDATVDVVVDNNAMAQVRIYAYERQANGPYENMRRPMEDWYRSDFKPGPYGNIIRFMTIVDVVSRGSVVNSRFWLLLPALMPSSMQYQVRLRQEFTYNEGIPERGYATQVAWALSGSQDDD